MIKFNVEDFYGMVSKDPQKYSRDKGRAFYHNTIFETDKEVDVSNPETFFENIDEFPYIVWHPKNNPWGLL